MPYKVVTVSLSLGATIVFGSIILGAVSEFWARRTQSGSFSNQLPIAVFFLFSGLLGTLFNWFSGIPGFPLLAVSAAAAGAGMLSGHVYIGAKNAS